MSSYTLNLFNTWQVTLPKKWRERYKTKRFIAKDTKYGLIIKPILEADDTVFYENDDWFWIYSSSWINPEEIISRIKKIQNG